MGRSNILLNEGGIRNIRNLSKRYPKAEIYFHQDLDGVTSAIGMKSYLEDNGIKVVDVHVIQYGDKEFSVKKNDATGDTMPVLVDFAHGKPMFVIHTDHHDSQVGVEKDTSKQFRGARSNVETISQIISNRDIFPNSDILLINTVDSADFARQNLTPDDVVNFVYNYNPSEDVYRNKMLLGLVINKLILAFKNKKNFLEDLVMKSNPSLNSILVNIKDWMSRETNVTPQELQRNADMYAKTMKTYSNQKVVDNIIIQYGGGNMFKPGSYDRYTAFRNNPDADFMIMIWPMGLVQASCNPFKGDRGLKGINLGEIAQEVLSNWEDKLKSKNIPLSTIKWISESSVNPESVGFTFKDFSALYGDKFSAVDGGDKALSQIEIIMDKPFKSLTESEKSLLDKISINSWDLIQSQSGGHKCITNISGLNYLGRPKRPVKTYGNEEQGYIKFSKMIGKGIFTNLREKMNS